MNEELKELIDILKTENHVLKAKLAYDRSRDKTLDERVGELEYAFHKALDILGCKVVFPKDSEQKS